MSGYLFEESQKFNQWYLWAIMGTSSLVFAGIIINALVQQLYVGEPSGPTELSDAMLVGMMVLMMGALIAGVWIFYRLQLETRVEKRGFHYRMLPFIATWRFIPKSEIKKFTIGPYRFRGLGILPGFLGTPTYNVRGKYGLTIHFGEKKVLIGTQRPQELESAFREMMDTKE